MGQRELRGRGEGTYTCMEINGKIKFKKCISNPSSHLGGMVMSAASMSVFKEP